MTRSVNGRRDRRAVYGPFREAVVGPAFTPGRLAARSRVSSHPAVSAAFTRLPLTACGSPVNRADSNQRQARYVPPHAKPGVNALSLPTSFAERWVVLREIRGFRRSAVVPADESAPAGCRAVPVSALFPLEFDIFGSSEMWVRTRRKRRADYPPSAGNDRKRPSQMRRLIRVRQVFLARLPRIYQPEAPARLFAPALACAAG
jgi:hypothetical protein